MTYEEFDSLPPHLLKLVSLLAVAKRNQAIADELVLSVGTVEQYVSELKQRLGATDRAGLALLCNEFVNLGLPTQPAE